MEMDAVTATSPLRVSLTPRGSYSDATWAGPAPAPVTAEENVARAALRLLSTCPGPAGHFGPMTLRMRPSPQACPSWARGLLSAQWELGSPWTCPSLAQYGRG